MTNKFIFRRLLFGGICSPIPLNYYPRLPTKAVLAHHNLETFSLFLPYPHIHCSLSFHLPIIFRTQLCHEHIHTSVSLCKHTKHPTQLPQKQGFFHYDTNDLSRIFYQLSDFLDVINCVGQFFHNKNNKYTQTLVENFQYIIYRVPHWIPH